MRRFTRLFTVVVFALIISGPAAKLICFPDPETVSEKRALAPRPAWPGPHRRDIKAFPAKFEAYFDDHFGFRGECVRLYHLAQVRWLGMSAAEVSSQRWNLEAKSAIQSGRSQVLLGKDGWLFFTGDRSLEGYRGTMPFGQPDLDLWQEVLEARQNWLSKRGIEYLLVIVPDKHSVYGEMLPRSLNVISTINRFDQLKDRLACRSPVRLLDLRSDLWAAKSSGQIYHRTDSHWNDLGAYWGYRAIANGLRDWFPSITPAPISEFNLTHHIGDGGDLANMLALADVLREERPVLVSRHSPKFMPRDHDLFQVGSRIVSESSDSQLPRAVFIHDSFLIGAERFLTECFSHVVYDWRCGEFPYETLEDERPDVVVQLIVERTLMSYRPVNQPDMEHSPVRWAKSTSAKMR